MSFSMSRASLPAFEIGLSALSAVLDKAAAFASARKIDENVFLDYRLAPDMSALARQVQIACDQAKNGAVRLSRARATQIPGQRDEILRTAFVMKLRRLL
jgi:hypothetical protein